MKSCARKILGTPLARWGFTILAVAALTQVPGSPELTVPVLVCAGLSYLSWEAKRP